MEDLTKQQIVLVTLLVSFVTSIATGIVTVTLMDQAPTGVTQTINRVVERTIERVVSEPSKSQSSSVVTKETIVVKEDDLVVSAIEKSAQSLVRLQSGAEEGSQVVALGVILTKDGIFAVDASNIVIGARYLVRLSDDVLLSAERVYNAEAQGLVLFKALPEKDKPVTFVPATLADSNGLKLGQTVVYLGGKESNNAKTGLISNLRYAKSVVIVQSTTTVQSTPVTRVTDISTDMQDMGSFQGTLANLSGETVGFGPAAYTTKFFPSNELKAALDGYGAWQKEIVLPADKQP